MRRSLKRLALLWGLLCLGVGALVGLDFLVIAVLEGESGLEVAAPMLAGLGGGLLVTIAASRSLRNRPARPFRLPPAWALAGGFILALAAGLGLSVEGSAGLMMALCAIAAAALAPLAVAAWVLQSSPLPAEPITARRGLAALGLGGTAGVVLALVLNMLLAGVAGLLLFGLAGEFPERIGGALDLLTGGLFGNEWPVIEVVVVLIEIAVLVPLAEEIAKPLALLPVLKRLPSARDALLLGVLAGAGFAAVENALYAGMFGEEWGGVLAVRCLGAAVHPLGAGLMAMAWWGLLHHEAQGGRRWVRNYALAVGVHGLWNGTTVVAVVLARAWFGGWEVSLLGITDSAVLLALLALEGLGLLVALVVLGRRPAPAGATGGQALVPALPTERAVAVWGVACLAVLLPVGLAIVRSLWSSF